MVLLVAVAVIIGMFVSAQAGINSELRAGLGQPLVAAMISFAIGTAALFLVVTVGRVPWPSASEAARVPWWGWLGGLLGAVFVTASVMIASRLGAGVFTAAVVAGQLAAAIVLDHFGILGFERQSITTTRVIGALVLFAGVYLIQRK